MEFSVESSEAADQAYSVALRETFQTLKPESRLPNWTLVPSRDRSEIREMEAFGTRGGPLNKVPVTHTVTGLMGRWSMVVGAILGLCDGQGTTLAVSQSVGAWRLLSHQLSIDRRSLLVIKRRCPNDAEIMNTEQRANRGRRELETLLLSLLRWYSAAALTLRLCLVFAAMTLSIGARDICFSTTTATAAPTQVLRPPPIDVILPANFLAHWRS
jgi:hypothetical protein